MNKKDINLITEAYSNIKDRENDYIVAGNGIYQFSLLPDKYKKHHKTFEEAVKFRNFLSTALSQSPLYFKIFKKDTDETYKHVG